MRRLRQRLTYANVMATLAVFIALGGTTYAATGGNFILGKSNSASTATQLSSGAGNALKVTDTNGGTGIYASGGNHSKNTAAVHAQSGAGNAVDGYSTANPASGVYGQDNGANSYGVAGHSDNGVAVVGDSSNGWAFQALGNTTQTRNRSGFVKAMALIDPTSTPAEKRCFNSQLAPSQGPASIPCGITFNYAVDPSHPGQFDVDFGFPVNDRFVSVSAQSSSQTVGAFPAGSPSDRVFVSNRCPSGLCDSPFYIFVY
jgi:hypothetical protein